MARGFTRVELQQRCEELQEEVDRLRDSEAALQESEMKYRTLFETMSDDITERKQVSERLGILAELLDVVPASVTVHDFQGNFIYANRKTFDLHGYSHDEFLALNLHRLDVPESQRLFESRMRTILEQGEATFEVSHYRKDGTILPLQVTAKLAKWGDQPVILNAAIDIGERKQAEEALRVSEERFRLLVENAPDAIFVRMNGRFAYVNQAAVKLFGASSPDELLGTPVLDRFHPDFRARAAERMKRIDTERAKLAPVESKYLRLDGTSLDAEAYPVRFVYEGQKGALVFVRDTTERKRAEEALKESEARFRLLVESARDAIFVRIKDRFAYVNPAAVRLFGASSPEELLGRSVLDRVHPDYRARAAERMKRIDTERAILPLLESKYLRLDGSPVDVESSPVPFEYEDRPGVLVFARDITDRKRAEQERRSLEAQLRQAQKMEAIGTLAGGIAHDFNNILGVIIGCTELALLDLPEETAAYRHLKGVYRAGERAKDLVKQILAFSRRGEQAKKALDPSIIVKEALKMLRSSLPSTIQIQQDIRRDCGTVLADPTHLHQVLMNLCVNAGHAMREKGGILTVDMKAVKLTAEDAAALEGARPGGYCMLTVSDTGHGMDQAILERIFDPYFTTKGAGEGTGLGLAVVHGIVKGHGGAIRVDSEPGKGSTFEILLPAIDQGTGAEAAVDIRTAPGGTERILFVDDEESLVETGREILEGLGYRVTATKSSLEALEIFRARPDQFDLVITDMTMPHMTGSELSRQMLQIRPTIPVILCTGYSDIMTPEKAKGLGIREFVVKPIPLRDLAEAIRKVLGGH